MMQYPEVKMDMWILVLIYLLGHCFTIHILLIMLQFGRLLVRPKVKFTPKQVGSNSFDYVHDNNNKCRLKCPKRDITF